jgi:polyisoprenoid-binding protein YceI
MKIISFIFAAIVFSFYSFASSPTTYTIDVTESSIEWTGNRAVGGGHNGTLNIKEGSLIFLDGVFSGGSFVIDMTTINTTDLTGERKQRLDNHLKNEDFFHIDVFPTATLVLKSVAPAGTGRFRVTGDITIKGITKTIEFPAAVALVGGRVVASASFSFDRTEFNVRYGSGSFFDNLGNRAISDEIPLVINLVGKK